MANGSAGASGRGQPLPCAPANDLHSGAQRRSLRAAPALSSIDEEHTRSHDVTKRRAIVAKAPSVILRHRRACPLTSGSTWPSGRITAVVETKTRRSSRTARLKPIVGSIGEPELMC
jgi:hypothetical protein